MVKALFNKISPVQWKWIAIAVAVLGGAGLLYWLLRPRGKAVSKTPSLSNAEYQQQTYGKVFSVAVDEFNAPVDGKDQGGGNYMANPSWYVADYGAWSGTDYMGNPFITDPAPMIPFEAKNQPYRFGVDYSFPEQTARGVANWNRFPEFYLTDAKIHSMGPWYNDPAANNVFSRGITTITALPGFRQGPTSVRQLPQNRKNWMCPDDILWHYAGELCNNLGPGHPYYDTLRQLSDDKMFVADSGAFLELGKYVWQMEAPNMDENGQGMRYMSLDIEASNPASFENWNVCMGYFYEGFCSAAAADGVTVRPYTYGGPEQVTIEPFSNRNSATGLPEYLDDQYDFLANVDAKVAAVAEFGGVFAVDTYQQGIWGTDNFYVRDESGTPVLDGNGRPVYAELSATVAYGQIIPIEPGEADKCLRDLYQQATRLYLQNHRMAGQYPAVKGMHREGFEIAQIGSFTRYTGEGMEGVQLNDRPLPSWLAELFNAMNLFLTPHLWCWGVDFNHEPDGLGTDHSNVWSYQAHGVAEFIMKAAHRHSAFASIQNSPFKWCWFNLPMVDNMQTDGNGYFQKALAFGKIRDVNGTVFLELLFAFPATDRRSTPFQVIVQEGGSQSVFDCELLSGRHYYYDCWKLPSNYSYDRLEGGNVTISYADVLNVTRSHRGDYRQN